VAKIGSDGSAAGYEQSSTDMLFGADANIKDTVIGMLAGYSNTSIDSDDAADVGIKTYNIAAYGRAEFDEFFVRGTLGYAYNDYASSRAIAIGGVDSAASGSTYGYNVYAAADLGSTIKMNGGTVLEPWVGLLHNYVYRDGFTETGANNFNLTVADKSISATRTTVGLRAVRVIQKGDFAYEPALSLRWDHDFVSNLDLTNTIAGQSFTTNGVDVGKDTGTIGVGLVVRNSTYQMGIDYGFSFQDNVTAHTLGLKFSREF
jgi:uncharacterized protein with beta-barrel porin domain